MPATEPSARPDSGLIRNRTFAELTIGDSASMERTLGADDIALFAVMSGDVNPQHLDPEFAASTRFHGVIAHGMWGAALISALLGTRLPGPGTIYLGQTLRFLQPVRVGDTLTVKVTVGALDQQSRRAKLACSCVNQHGKIVIEGEAEVIAPSEPIARMRSTLPEVRLLKGTDMPQLLQHVRQFGTIRVAVVHPCDEASLGAALDAHRAGLIEPLLVGPAARIRAVAAGAGWSLDEIAVDDVPHSHAAAARGAQLASQGQVAALMKGSLHTDELIGAVLAPGAGLRTERRLSHCYLMQTPAYPRPFIITDAAINIAPDLEAKADIVRNAIELAHAIGVALPRVAILAAVETVNPRMAATLDAAALCKMAERGQIAGAVLDGPLAFDNAVSPAAARLKGIVSEVAGQADILVVPDLESGNMLAKQLEYMGDAASAGVVLGARVPIILTSRADPRASRIASCAIALLLARRPPAPGMAR